MIARPIPDQAIQEAAQWLARMQNDERTATDEADFERWLRDRPENAAAFDHVTHVWDLAGAASGRRREPRPTRRALVTALGGVAAVGLGFTAWGAAEARTVRTAIGEQRRLTTPDGTRVVLDTDSALVVRRSGDQRRAVLKRGRSAFSVLEQDGRPFVVETGDWTLSCLSGDFDVCADDLGAALVVRAGAVKAARGENPAQRVVAGSRLDLNARLAGATPQAVDLETAQAWRTGQLVFADVRLADAAAALNRYARKPIAVSGDLGDMRISGAYRTGAPEAFAEAAAVLTGSKVVILRDRINIIPQGSAS